MSKVIIIESGAPRAKRGNKSYTVSIIRGGVYHHYDSVPYKYMSALRKNPQGAIEFIYDDQTGEFID